MNVFLILSPLQMINALEAKHHFGLPTSDCTLVTSKSGYRQFVDIGLTNDSDWGEIKQLAETKNRLLRRYRDIKEYSRVASEIQEAEKIFLGSYALLQSHHFINNVKHRTIYLLDDGNVTRHIYSYRNDPRWKSSQIIFRKPFNRLIQKILFGIKEAEIRKLNYFTIYDLQANKNETIIKNTYSLLKSHNSPGILDEVHFLGSPLVELGILKGKTYLRYMEHVVAYFAPLEVVYFPHRREARKNIQKLAIQLGIKIEMNDIPIELFYLRDNSIPKNLSAFYSSAVDNCRCLFGDNMAITCFYLQKKDINRRYRYGVEVQYNYLSNCSGNNFNVRRI